MCAAGVDELVVAGTVTAVAVVGMVVAKVSVDESASVRCFLLCGSSLSVRSIKVVLVAGAVALAASTAAATVVGVTGTVAVFDRRCLVEDRRAGGPEREEAAG